LNCEHIESDRLQQKIKNKSKEIAIEQAGRAAVLHLRYPFARWFLEVEE
jgi:hypothetical protein